MPYSFLLNLFFWPDSIVSLWSSVRHLFRNLFGRKRPDVLLAVVLIAYAIAHVLFFGALWSAATGYQNPGTAVFAMPDGSWVTKDNSTLRLCWLVDSQRLGNLLPADGVVLGPRFGSIFQSFSDLDLEGRPESMWDVYPNIDQSEDVEDFHDIFSCELHLDADHLGAPNARHLTGMYRCSIQLHDAELSRRPRVFPIRAGLHMERHSGLLCEPWRRQFDGLSYPAS